jgi:radical SAM superfamily enzyme YgiQ (UPF0313 family)
MRYLNLLALWPASTFIFRFVRHVACIAIFFHQLIKKDDYVSALCSDYIDLLRRFPFNRISIGIQSFNDAELRFLNRRHDTDKALKSLTDFIFLYLIDTLKKFAKTFKTPSEANEELPVLLHDGTEREIRNTTVRFPLSE